VQLTNGTIEFWSHNGTAWTRNFVQALVNNKNTNINRANATVNVAPTATEAPSPVSGDTATVTLNSGVIEFYNYTGSAWVKVSATTPVTLDGNNAIVTRTNNTAGVAPTAVEVPSPINGDTADLYLLDGTREVYAHNGTAWALIKTIALYSPDRFPVEANNTAAGVIPAGSTSYRDADGNYRANITLPTAVGRKDQIFTINHTATNNATLSGTNKIPGTPVVLTPGNRNTTYISNGVGWLTVATPGNVTTNAYSAGFVSNTFTGSNGITVNTTVTANPQTPGTAFLPFNNALIVETINTGPFVATATGITVNRTAVFRIDFKSDVNTTTNGSGGQLLVNGVVVDFAKFNENSLAANTDGQLNLYWLGSITAGQAIQVSPVRESAAGSDTFQDVRILIQEIA